MGNLDTFGGPLPEGWHLFTVQLQHKILARMRGLGMTPVLPAFAGYVPANFPLHFPNSSYHKQYWNKFGPTLMLDPNDKLFEAIGAQFIREYTREFGESDHVYNTDAFNEIHLDNNSTDFIRESGAAVFNAMTSVDPQAVWVMQGWLFKEPFWTRDRAKALLQSVEVGAMIVLDLDSTYDEHYSELDSYFGQPFIFNDLNNFGGNVGLFGRIQAINLKVFEARNRCVYGADYIEIKHTLLLCF